VLLNRALAAPGRYSLALTKRRRARSLPSGISFGAAFEYAQREVGITQVPDEIEWLFELVRSDRPRTVLEIGFDRGGTLFLWTRAATDDARLIAVDAAPPGALGLWSPFPLTLRGFATGRQRVDLLMSADSHAPATVGRVRRLLNGGAVDFLFVDGDHSYEGAWSDFRTYGPLVRPNGLIAFHDVSPSPSADTEGTSRFWQEFKASHETDERVVDHRGGFGIGVYRVPG
jgi:predicted O-methyltransferase YrrM